MDTVETLVILCVCWDIMCELHIDTTVVSQLNFIFVTWYYLKVFSKFVGLSQ